MTEKVLLGVIVGVHGIRGEVALKTFTAEPDGIADYGPLTDQHGVRHEIKGLRITPKGVVARLANVTDRTAAERLRGSELYVDRDRLPPADEDEFYVEDLRGLKAFSPDGAELGEVVSVQNYGAGDLVEVRLIGRRQTELVPFTEAIVPDIDIAGRRLTLVMPTYAPDDRGDQSPPPRDQQAEDD